MNPRSIAAAGAAVIALALIGATALALGGGARPAATGRGGADDIVARLPDHRALSFRCLGHGAPTVILESGFGAGAEAWGKVQPLIAPVTRVCAYSRAGYGLSDPGPMPRDGEAIARDLDFGLKAARIRGPFVIVGHSAGGLYARVFAARRRRDVVGLVFVDTSVEHQTRRLVALFGPNAGNLDGVRRRPERCLAATLDPRAPGSEAVLADCAPASLDPRARAAALRPATWRTELSELDTLFASASDEVDRTRGLLRDIPAIVLTASKADGVSATPDDPGALAWQGFHRGLAASFRHGDQRMVKSSHLMMLDRPQVVADAALELVRKARAP